jgi:hypothetical protein
LRLKTTASSAETAVVVHGLLEGVTLPTKYIISMLTVACFVSGAEQEGLGAILRPVILIVELGGVPDDLTVMLVKDYIFRNKIRRLRTSSISCGILTGWLAGQFPVDKKFDGPPVG